MEGFDPAGTLHPALPDQDGTIERSHLPYFRLLQAIAVCACARFAGLVSSGKGASSAMVDLSQAVSAEGFSARSAVPQPGTRIPILAFVAACAIARLFGRLGSGLRGRRVLHRRHLAHARALLFRSPAAASMDRARHRRLGWRRLVAEAAVLADGARHQRSPLRPDAPAVRARKRRFGRCSASTPRSISRSGPMG